MTWLAFFAGLALGGWGGWYFSVMIDDRLTPQGDE
jgi:hypothetical protein